MKQWMSTHSEAYSFLWCVCVCVCVCAFCWLRVYMCVCVCVCVRVFLLCIFSMYQKCNEALDVYSIGGLLFLMVSDLFFLCFACLFVCVYLCVCFLCLVCLCVCVLACNRCTIKWWMCTHSGGYSFLWCVCA
jgi:hypothetical protein